MKPLYIAEKPSVAREFARVLGINSNKNGYMESDKGVVTWCVGHLVTMSYPEKYDEKYKKWSLSTLPFLPEKYKYEIIKSAKDQYKIVESLLKRDDIDEIFVCTDAGREGEYIYRLVEMMAGSKIKNKIRKRVWIDSQTDDEIMRGIREAKDLSEYDNLSDSAFLRAKEDYLMGINFSRLLTVKYGQSVTNLLGGKWTAISVGRVMTCVLGMVVRREREIRDFVKTTFYKVEGTFSGIKANWRVCDTSSYFNSPTLYKDNGFKSEEDAKKLISELEKIEPAKAVVTELTRKTEKKNPPLLYNLAEIQNDSSKLFKCSPDETLAIIQELYEKKLVTYPRTDARVLSSAVAKEIKKNVEGLVNLDNYKDFAQEIINDGLYADIEKSRYTNDKQVTDHYAIIPTGQGLNAITSLDPTKRAVYNLIVTRFLSIFYPAAEFKKISLVLKMGNEEFTAGAKECSKEGYLKVVNTLSPKKNKKEEGNEQENEEPVVSSDVLKGLSKGSVLDKEAFEIKEGETTPPKRYTSGSIILAMENAGALIEDEELRAQIKGSGIGTSATRAEILKKLISIKYLSLQKKTQVLTPTLLGEIIYDTVDVSLKQMLNPELTASWEKGLTYVAEGSVSSKEYMDKLESFISKRVDFVSQTDNTRYLRNRFHDLEQFYFKKKGSKKA